MLQRGARGGRKNQPRGTSVKNKGSIGFALALGLTAAYGTGHAAYTCEQLSSVTSEAATMTSATVVTPPAVIGGTTINVPFCRVTGTARPSSDSEIKFEVWL